MIRKLRERFEHLIISLTGMSYDEEIQQTAKLLDNTLYYLHCLHCILPHCGIESIWARMEWLRQFTPSVGLKGRRTLGTMPENWQLPEVQFIWKKHFTELRITRQRSGNLS